MAEKENKSDKVEREYTIPLRREWEKVPRYKRAKKAIKAIKEFLAKHMKVRDRDLNKIRVDRFLNEEVWFRGIKNPPSKIKVKATKEGDIVRVELAVLPNALKFKKAKEEKTEKIAVEAGKKHHEEHKPVEEKTETAEKKIETEEKKEATVEAMEKIEKEEHKKAKHEMKAKTPKQEKNQRVGYNKSSRGK